MTKKKLQTSILTTNQYAPQGLAQTVCESISNVAAVVSTRILDVKKGDFLFHKNDFLQLLPGSFFGLLRCGFSVPVRFSVLIIDGQPIYLEDRTLHTIKPEEIMEIYAAGISTFENLVGVVIICDEADKHRFENL